MVGDGQPTSIKDQSIQLDMEGMWIDELICFSV